MYIIIQQHLTKKDENDATGGKNVKLADDAFCKIRAACRLVSSMGVQFWYRLSYIGQLADLRIGLDKSVYRHDTMGA